MARQASADPSWRRIAALLVSRRIDLDPRYRNRRVFCREKKIEYRVISDIEGARRTNFSTPMITAIEVAYEVAEGSIKAALADSSIKRLPERRTRQTAGTTSSQTRTNPDIPQSVSLPDLEEWEQHIWLTPDLTVEQRRAAIHFVRLQRGDLAGDSKALLHLSNALNQMVARHLAREQDPPQAS
ncbi:hypothetical protein [Actinomadura sp. CNU-125]|uniref:hypothetical protein n=1 Tax=Actinomadura sp. CNU-125 TaxID=1904961 RepID=UPI001178404E|nr:hypothetical protein [Actinomadura sp. CNU-125]